MTLLPFGNDVNRIVDEYACSYLQVVRYILNTTQYAGIIKDIVYLNGNIILELMSTTPNYSLVVYPNINVDWTLVGNMLRITLKYWDNKMTILPLKCKGTVPIPEKLLYYGNDHEDLNINIKPKLFLYIDNISVVGKAMEMFDADPEKYFCHPE